MPKCKNSAVSLACPSSVMKYSSLLLGLLLFCSGLFAQERLSLEGTWDFKLLGKGEAGSPSGVSKPFSL